LNARITFGNIFAITEPVEGVHRVPVDSSDSNNTPITKWTCTVDESCFEPAADYQVIGGDGDDLTDGSGFNDEDYMSYTADALVHQYINNRGSAGTPNGGDNGDQTINNSSSGDQVTFLEAIKTNQDMDPDLQR